MIPKHDQFYFKAAIYKLCRDEGLPFTEAAEKMGVSETTARNWRKNDQMWDNKLRLVIKRKNQKEA